MIKRRIKFGQYSWRVKLFLGKGVRNKVMGSCVVVFCLIVALCAVLILRDDSSVTVPNFAASNEKPTIPNQNTSSSRGSGSRDFRNQTVDSDTVSDATTPVEDRAEYGISTGSSLTALNTEQLQLYMKDVKDLGVKWIRLDLPWHAIQVTANTYDWRSFDRVVESADKNDIKILAILDYNVSWNRKADCPQSMFCEPADNASFAAFAAAAAKRYSSRGIRSWEVWNEQNTANYWKPKPSAVAYTDLLKQTYKSIKAVDPQATVLVGGLGIANPAKPDIDSVKFLSAIYDHGGKGYFDGVAYHPYTYPVLPSSTVSWNVWSKASDSSPSIRSIMVDHGDSDKKIWITEFGAPTNGSGVAAGIDNLNMAAKPTYVTEQLQSAMVTDAIEKYKSQSYYGPFFWYSLKDRGTDKSTTENFFGLIRADGSKKPGYWVFSSLVRQ